MRSLALATGLIPPRPMHSAAEADVLRAPGGAIAFHDARHGAANGFGSIGVTAVVDELFRGEYPVTGWTLDAEVDGLVAVRRDR